MSRADVLRTVASDLNSLVDAGTFAGWALCGGLALAVWGAPRATLDIDVLADLAEGRPDFDREVFDAGKRRLRIRGGKP